MLQYFPTPYPDEPWYSVLGRYHVRSGNPNSATTLRELFGEESVGGMGNFLPNCGIRRVAEKLPLRFYPSGSQSGDQVFLNIR